MKKITAEEQEDRDEQERTATKKRLLLEALDKGRGIISIATSHVGINRTTYYAWCKSDPEFKKQVKLIRSKKADILEDAVMAKAIGGDMQALKMLLPVYHPDFKNKRQEKKEVHIHYHHDGKPGPQPQRTLEDLMDLLDAEESGVYKPTMYSVPVPIDLSLIQKASPIQETKAAPKKQEAAETPRERRIRIRNEKSKKL